MAYAEGSAKVLEIVRRLPQFSVENSSDSDWRVLSSGKSDVFVVLRRGEFETQWLAPTLYLGRWQTIVEVWQLVMSESDDPGKLHAHHDAIVDELMKWPYLDGVADDSSVSGSGRPDYKALEGGLLFYYCEITVAWENQNKVQFVE
jgi:hypothetical protein